MSSGNILKPWFTNPNAEKTVVIDANKRMMTRIAEYEEQKRQEQKMLESEESGDSEETEESEDGFVAGLFAEKIETFTDENGNLVYQNDDENDITKLLEPNPDYEPKEEATNQETEGEKLDVGGMSAEMFQANWDELNKEKEYLEVAKQEYANQESILLKEKEEVERSLQEIEEEKQKVETLLEQKLQEANEEADSIREEAKKEGFQAGYDDGKAKADEELEIEKQKLEQERTRLEEEYEEKIRSLEPQFAESFMSLYRHIFQIDFSKYQDMVPNLILSTFQKIENGKSFMVHVSKSDFPMVNQKKKQIMDAVPNNATLEIVEDYTLKETECFIETESGIYDCGLDTQLEELEKEIRVLAYRRG